MKKTERLNDMMRYLSDKSRFGLKDLMSKYEISRSTALRDIQSLEAIGMPIYSQVGRNGYYGILPNRLLSPIVFHTEEVYALYFAMQSLTAYQSTPFDFELAQLKEKFENCLLEPTVQKLRTLEAVVAMNAPIHASSSTHLKAILEFALTATPCDIAYQKGASVKHYSVQFLKIKAAHGQWYTEAYDFVAEKKKTYRCDKVLSVESTAQFKAIAPEAADTPHRSPEAVAFCVEVDEKGADRFYREHYPSMAINRQACRYRITGYYNLEESGFIAAYFLAYGTSVRAVYPEALKDLIVAASRAVNAHYEAL